MTKTYWNRKKTMPWKQEDIFKRAQQNGKTSPVITVPMSKFSQWLAGSQMEELEDTRVILGPNCRPFSKKHSSRSIFSLDYPMP